jgi:hypothetical protein
VSCATCRHWEHQDGPPDDHTAQSGLCRRYAPRAMFIVPLARALLATPAEMIDDDDESVARDATWQAWPRTWGNDWCGEYARHGL